MRISAGAAVGLALFLTMRTEVLGSEWRALRGALAEIVLNEGRGREALEGALVELRGRFPAVAASMGREAGGAFAEWTSWSRALGSEDRAAVRSLFAVRELEENVAAIERTLVRRGFAPAAREGWTRAAREAALLRSDALFGARAHADGWLLGRAGFLRGATPGATERTEAAHAAITHDLFHGEAIRGEPFSANGNQTRILRVWVRNPRNGRVREALFKPRPWGDGDGWNRTPMEYIAYEMNRLLGMDYVPPVAYRKPFRVGGDVYPEGALIYFVPDAHALRAVAFEEWGESPRLLLSDSRILDTLLQNSDRHVNQFLRGRHWVDGAYRPVLIDHAASLRLGSRTHLGHDDAFAMGPVRVIRYRTWEALLTLDRAGLERLSEFLAPGEIERILARRDGILAEIEAGVEERGFAGVVVDAPPGALFP